MCVRFFLLFSSCLLSVFASLSLAIVLKKITNEYVMRSRPAVATRINRLIFQLPHFIDAYFIRLLPRRLKNYFARSRQVQIYDRKQNFQRFRYHITLSPRLLKIYGHIANIRECNFRKKIKRRELCVCLIKDILHRSTY